MGGCIEEACTHSETKGTTDSLSHPYGTDHIGGKGECYEEKWKENSLRKMGTGIMNSLHWCGVCLVCPLFQLHPTCEHPLIHTITAPGILYLSVEK